MSISVFLMMLLALAVGLAAAYLVLRHYAREEDLEEQELANLVRRVREHRRAGASESEGGGEPRTS